MMWYLIDFRSKFGLSVENTDLPVFLYKSGPVCFPTGSLKKRALPIGPWDPTINQKMTESSKGMLQSSQDVFCPQNPPCGVLLQNLGLEQYTYVQFSDIQTSGDIFWLIPDNLEHLVRQIQ